MISARFRGRGLTPRDSSRGVPVRGTRVRQRNNSGLVKGVLVLMNNLPQVALILDLPQKELMTRRLALGLLKAVKKDYLHLDLILLPLFLKIIDRRSMLGDLDLQLTSFLGGIS